MCRPGKTSAGGNTNCVPCNTGYTSRFGNLCTLCPAGQTSAGDGIWRPSDTSYEDGYCRKCPEGSISTLPACTLKFDGPRVASRFSLPVATVESLRNYELTFTMKLADNWTPGVGWRSILHIGADDYGQRLPAIWFHDEENALTLRQTPGDWGFTTFGIAFEKSKTYEVKVIVKSTQMALYINGDSIPWSDGRGVGAGSGPSPAGIVANMPVYVGSPWYASAEVTLSDICLRPTYAAGPVCQPCTSGKTSDTARTGCVNCAAGTFSDGDGICENCEVGKYSIAGQGTCTDCVAGKSSPEKSTSSSACDFCPDGWISSAGEACRTCDAGWESNPGYTACVRCDAGYKSSAGGMCTPCNAGETSNSGRTACKNCDAGSYSSISTGVWATTDGEGGTCELCGPGKYSSSGADKCENCGNPDAWDPKYWDPTQRGAASSEECKCARGFTGTDCDRADCEPSPDISLGFLLLETQWPRHERTLSRNEAFSGIAGAFRSFDENSDDRLSVVEARRAIRDGGMAVPLEVTHIWSPDGVKMLKEGDVTITEMVEYELARLEEQKTEEYYERPSGSGEITAMEATYPNNHDGDDWSNEICEAQSTEPPKLTWTVERNEKVIYQQCAYFNGIALDSTTGLKDTISSGGDCNEDPSKCSYEFQLPTDNIYKVTSYKPSGDCTKPGATLNFQGTGHTLRCVELPNGELVDVLEVEGGTQTCRHTDANSCPAGYDIWVPRSYDHAKAVVDAVDPKFTELVGVYRKEGGCGGCTDVAMNSEAYDEWVAEGTNRVPWTSVAASPWFLRETAFSQPDGDYDASCWLAMAHGWDDGVGFNFDDNGCGNCFTNYLCSRNGAAEVLNISKHSYCVETKFCPVGTTDCTKNTVDAALAVMRCITGLQYNGTPMDLHPRALGRLGVEISWLYTSTTAKIYRVYKFDPPMAKFATDSSLRLLREVVLSTAECGLRFDPDDFRDTTTGSQPGINVGYAVVPVDGPDDDLDELKDKAGVSSFVVTWWGDVAIDVVAEGGGPVREALVKVSHLVDGEIDPSYTDFVQKQTDAYGKARLPVRVQDPSWSDLTQHFRVTVEKNSTRPNKTDLVHVFEPSYVDMEVRHLLEATSGFTDVTSATISGTVAHDGFGTKKVSEGGYFANECPHTKFQLVAKSFDVSGSNNQDGTYRLDDDLCNDMPHYKCVDCSSDQYIWYDTGKWLIGSDGCGSATADIRVDDANGDLEAVPDGTWEEKNGVYFNPISGILVTAGSSYKKIDTKECMCPVEGSAESSSRRSSWRVALVGFTQVDGAELFIERASAGEEKVVLNNGKFAHAVLLDETVTLSLRMYNGTNGVVPHSFTVTHDAGDKATTADGQEPAFMFTAEDDAVVHFLDVSTQTLNATYVVGPNRTVAEYVNGVPVVAKVERCGWERPVWAVRGVADFELGAAAVEVRALGDDEVKEPKYYHPPGASGDVPGCLDTITNRDDMIERLGDLPVFLKGCRAEIPKFPGTESPGGADCTSDKPCRLPCATMDKTYVDELPTTRKFDVDLSILGTGSADVTQTASPTLTDAPTTTPTILATTNAQVPVEFVIASQLCLASVNATAVTTLQSLLTDDKKRESVYDLPSQESLLFLKELPAPEKEGLYGKACTNNTGAVFRERDAVSFEFAVVEREPVPKYFYTLYPWDKADCEYKDTAPSADHPIAIRVADGVSKTEKSATYGNESFTHNMTAGAPNPFAPFSHELSVEFTRAFEGARILFVRHALVLGVIPEEVPQVWTVATNPTLIFLILRDPPGGGSFATLTEGSAISTSMAIDGSHAAELANSVDLGSSTGISADMSVLAAPFGIGIEQGVVNFGLNFGRSYSHSSPDVTVSRSSSRHFDVGISFATGISTSDSPSLPGQPSDVIIGGGANLRFISAIEIFAKETGTPIAPKLCLAGLTTKQFLPEQITTWVMSVYEIEKTIERMGAALTDPNTKMEAKDGVPDPRKDLVKQIENWQTVLANYRTSTIRDQAKSVADQLTQELGQLQTKFQGFLAEANDGNFKDFLVDGLNELEGDYYDATRGAVAGAAIGSAAGPLGAGIGAAVGGAVGGALSGVGAALLKTYDSANQDRVNRAGAAEKCASAAKLADPRGDPTLCKVYQDIHEGLALREKLLFGICDFQDDNPSVEAFCNRDYYRPGKTREADKINAFDALYDTTHFITFSGTTGLEFSWDIAQSRGAELTSTHDAIVADALGFSVGGGVSIGRRLESSDDGVPGYAYPISGRVLAVSKKLLAVTPEALERRRLQLRRLEENEAEPDAESVDLVCRRRLDGTKLSDEERRRLGVTACAGFEGGTSSSFAVSMGRVAAREAEHTRTVAISLKDDDLEDVFAVRISQDSVFGTPIFTTMGGSSSCVGETGTTRRDSRVTIKEIKPLCVSDKDIKEHFDSGEALCKSKLTCECKDLAPGEGAIFSVVLQNLSPWVGGSVTYLLRAGFGSSTAWDSGKYTRDINCDPGDPGDLVITNIADNYDLRDGTGILLDPLNYGQFEVKVKVSLPDFALSCFSFEDIEFELVSECEKQGVYQYQTSMDEKTGDVTVIHPKFVGRPVGLNAASDAVCKTNLNSLCADEASAGTKCEVEGIVEVGGIVDIAEPVAKATYRGEGKWCYSDLNHAVGCTSSPATCWTSCTDKVAELNELHKTYDANVDVDALVKNNQKVAKECPTAFIQVVTQDDGSQQYLCNDKGKAIELKAIDWEEETGQCRCQNSCECTVEDLYTYNITKIKGTAGYKTRNTTTHLLTKDGLDYPPKDKDKAGKNVTCGLYTFTNASKARGPDTSKATFDVSWKNETRGCRYPAASNYNQLATVDDGKCEFSGCMYEAASNYDPKATKDDNSCVFGPEYAPRDVAGGSCMSGVDLDSKALVRLYQNTIAKLAGVDPAYVKVDAREVSSCGGNGRRRLSGGFELSFTIETHPDDTDAVEEKMAGVTEAGIDAALKNQAAEDGVNLGDAATEGLQDLAVTTATPAPTVTAMPTARPTAVPTSGPTLGPTLGPTARPTPRPTAAPTVLCLCKESWNNAFCPDTQYGCPVVACNYPERWCEVESGCPSAFSDDGISWILCSERNVASTPGPTPEPTPGPTPGPTPEPPCLCKDSWEFSGCADTQYGCPADTCDNFSERWCVVDPSEPSCDEANYNDGVYWIICSESNVAPTAGPTLEPTPVCTCDKELEVTVRTDDNPEETRWTVTGEDCRGVLEQIESDVYTEKMEEYVSDNNFLCEGGTYKFEIFDLEDDGICCDYGEGEYILQLDGVELKKGGNFGGSDVHEFFVQFPPTPAPTAVPTTGPTPTPSAVPTARPTAEPTPVCTCDKELEVTVRTDDYPEETSWTVTGQDCRGVLEQIESDVYTEEMEEYVSDKHFLCEGGKYKFEIFDSHGDGINAPGGYSLKLDGVEIQRGSVSGSGEVYDFFGTNAPTFKPTPAPTAMPTVAPTPGQTPEPTAGPTSVPVPGCKYRAAKNFNPLATVDDDSCVFVTSGCTYPSASNYNSEATVDDGTCEFGARLEPVMIQGSFCIAGVNMTEESSIEEMLRVLVGVVTGLTDGASFSFDISPASSCAPTRRLLEGSASVVEAKYSVGVKSNDVAEANSIVEVLKDREQLNIKLHAINQAATIETADALVLATTSTDGPTPGPTPAPKVGPTTQPTPAPSTEETAEPTAKPIPVPTAAPTAEPTADPTSEPTAEPTTTSAPITSTTTTTLPSEPSAAPTFEPTAEPTAAPTAEPSSKPTAAPTAQPTGKPTPAPIADETEGPTAQPTGKPTPAPIADETEGPTAAPTPWPTAQPTGKPTPAPTAEPSSKPTAAPTAEPTSEPTAAPTAQPTGKPTPAPIADETEGPTAAPTPWPTAQPTGKPTPAPIADETEGPTAAPTPWPTAQPTGKPTPAPTAEPSSKPTAAPTAEPTSEPTAAPTAEPSSKPTATPTAQPTGKPTPAPTAEPSSKPTAAPTAEPTSEPTAAPTAQPTGKPTPAPIADETEGPTAAPTPWPTAQPTGKPTPAPFADETEGPTAQPTGKPTPAPIADETEGPTAAPTPWPTAQPTGKPTPAPFADETEGPTAQPTGKPTPAPIADETEGPTAAPTPWPTAQPTGKPTPAPTAEPSSKPTAAPTAQPTGKPTPAPIADETEGPTAAPTPWPTAQPTGKPTPAPFADETEGPTAAPTPWPTAQPTGKPTPAPFADETEGPTAQPTGKPTPAPIADETEGPTAAPTPWPTAQPTGKPTPAPFADETEGPTAQPTGKPTPAPIADETEGPTAAPTPWPTAQPTGKPTPAPTAEPSSKPTAAPTAQPTGKPTPAPIADETEGPTAAPTPWPTAQPTGKPTPAPTAEPSSKPTAAPTAQPTGKPTPAPIADETEGPTAAPTPWPTAQPTGKPTPAPSYEETAEPTAAPTAEPTAKPFPVPTAEPTPGPTAAPMPAPTAQPTGKPTPAPSYEETAEPTAAPTAEPTAAPTAEPTAKPISTAAPTAEPTAPSFPVPTAEPTAAPTPRPTTDCVLEETASKGICAQGLTYSLCANDPTRAICNGAHPSGMYTFAFTSDAEAFAACLADDACTAITRNRGSPVDGDPTLAFYIFGPQKVPGSAFHGHWNHACFEKRCPTAEPTAAPIPVPTTKSTPGPTLAPTPSITVVGSLSLTGIAAEDVDDGVRADLAVGIALAAGVETEAVTITSPAGRRRHRRGLLAGGSVDVEFEITTNAPSTTIKNLQSPDAADTIESAVPDLGITIVVGPAWVATEAPTPCRPCMTQADCDGSEICVVPTARRGLRFGSIQQEGCCRAR